MIGKDEDQQEVSYKVADRRKFNADGSVKEGVTLDAAPVKPAAPETASEETASAPDVDLNEITLDDEPADDSEAIPGAEDPASFVNFLSTLATNAAAALG